MRSHAISATPRPASSSNGWWSAPSAWPARRRPTRRSPPPAAGGGRSVSSAGCGAIARSAAPPPNSRWSVALELPEGGQGNGKIEEGCEGVARLAGSDVPPTNFFQDFLAKVMAGIESPAGAIWLRTPQGFLQLQCQTNLQSVNL